MSLHQVILLLALTTSIVAQPFTDGGFIALPNSWKGSGSGTGSGISWEEESGSGSGSGGPWEESGSGSGSGEIWIEESGSGSGSGEIWIEESGSGSGSGEIWIEESGSGSGFGEIWIEESGSGSGSESGCGSGSGELCEEESGSGSGSGEQFSGSGSDEVIPCEALMCPPGTRCQPGSVVCPMDSTCFTLPSRCVPTDPCAISYGISYTLSGEFSGSGEEGSGGSGYCPSNMENTKCGSICLEDCTVDLTYICANTPRCLCKTGQSLYIKRDETAECIQPESCPCK